MELSLDQALQQGVAAQKAGKLQDAERLYRAILRAQPENSDANHNLGVLAVAVGKPLEAIALFKLALQANPQIEQFWLSYIDALMKVERFDEAERVLVEGEKTGVSLEKLDAFKQRLQTSMPNDTSKTVKGQALSEKRRKLAEKKKKKNKRRKAQDSSPSVEPSRDQLNHLLGHYQAGRLEEAEALATLLTQQFPKHPLGWKVLGVVLKQTGRLGESLVPMQAALKLSLQDAEAHSNLGATLQELGRFDDAEASLRQAIALKPDYAEAHYNLGNALKQPDRLDEAQASYRRAIALRPDYAEAHSNLGATLQELGRLDEADASLRQAVALKPDVAEVHYNLGNALKQLGRLEEAETSYMQAITLRFDLAEVHYNLGNLFQQQGRLDEAEAGLRQAIALKPDYAEAHSNLGATLRELGRLDEAELSYRKAIALKSGFIVASRNILNLPVGQLDPKTLEWCEKLFPTLGKSAEDEAKSAFFRAKLLKHQGLIDQSFSEFCKANAFKLEDIQNEIALESESNIQSLNRIEDWVPRPPATASRSLVKLFIMGASKSGKSLIENILCQSAQVKPLFEAVQYDILERTVVNKSKLPGSIFNSIFFHSEDELLLRGYEVVTSTNPLSIFKADYFLDMVPNTYFLVIKRDIQDLSAEIFTEEYISGNYYSSDIEAITSYLSVYKKICEILIAKVPDRCLSLNFDDIIESPEATVGRIGELVSQNFEVDGLGKKGPKVASASIFRDHFAKN